MPLNSSPARARLSPPTVAKRLSVAKQVFRSAVRWGWLQKSPFDGLRPGSQANPARAFYVDQPTTSEVLAACPSQEWRVVVALCRYAGLRCPSEVGALTWADVNWEKGRLTVRAKKTEHHVAIMPSGWCRSAPSCGLSSARRSIWPCLVPPGSPPWPLGRRSTSALICGGSSRRRAIKPGPGCFRTCGRRVPRTGWRSTRPMSSPSGSDTPRRWLRPTTSRPGSITSKMSWQGAGPGNPPAQIPAHQQRRSQRSTFPQGLAAIRTKRQNPLQPLGLQRVLRELGRS